MVMDYNLDFWAVFVQCFIIALEYSQYLGTDGKEEFSEGAIGLQLDSIIET